MKLLLIIVSFLFVISHLFADTCPLADEKHKYLNTPIDYKNPMEGTFKFHYKLQNGFDTYKKTIILLHGGPGGNMTSWDLCPGSYCLSELSHDYNIVTLDERGAGCSLLPENKNEKFLTIQTTAEDIEHLRKHLVGNEGQVTILGESFGTIVGVVYTSKYDAQVEKLILMGSAYSNEYMLNMAFEKNVEKMLNANPEIRNIYKELKIKLENNELKISTKEFFDMRDILGYSYRGTWAMLPLLITQLNATDYSLWDNIISNLGTSLDELSNSPAYKYIMCRELFDYSFPDFYMKAEMENICEDFRDINPLWKKYTSKVYSSHIKTPTLLLVGSWDGPTSPWNTYKLDNDLSFSKAIEIPLAGHGVIFEKRECSIQLISSFLRNGFTPELDEIFKLDVCQN